MKRFVFKPTILTYSILFLLLCGFIYIADSNELDEIVPDEIIVGVKEGVHPNAIQAINGRFGVKVIYKFKIINAYQLRLPRGMTVPAAIKFYERQPIVEYAEPNYIVRADVIPNDPRFSDLWGLHNTGQTGGTSDADIDAPEAWEISVGSGEVIVASIDSGVDYNHEDLTNNMWVNAPEANGVSGVDDDGNGFVDDIYGYDFANDDGDPMDDNGHGTHTSGTIGAVGNNEIGVTGVCWNVKIMALKFLGAGGSGTTADAIKCIQYATEMGAHLSNNSWGGGSSSLPLLLAIAQAPLFVAASGNNGLRLPHYPAAYPLSNIISVAATDHNDLKARFSNYGRRWVDLAAPGVGIVSTMPGNEYESLDGTSMASPHVAGVAALVMSVNSDLSDLDVKDCILNSVDEVPDLEGLVLTGGRLNAQKALQCAMPAAPSITIAKSKTLTTNTNSKRISTSLGNAFPSPANPEVWIPYRLGVDSDVTITIYDTSGQLVRKLDIGHRPAGIYESKQLAAHWDGRAKDGETVSSGLYFYTLKTVDFTETRKLLIIR